MKSVIRNLHQQLISGNVTCRELVKEKISLLTANKYHSANLILEESALALAEQVDEKIKTGQSIGLLEGIPFGIQDVLLLQGSFASGSSGFLKNYVASYTATVVNKLMAAGAIPVVKENGDSMGHGCTGGNTFFGAVLHAHETGRVAGGANGGSAVNVSKGYTVFSVGANTGGAIPAGYNKVYGLKPTYGRVSRYGLMANSSSTDCVGPVAASLEDIPILMNVMSGKDAHDLTTYASTPLPENIFETKMAKEKITVGYYKSFLENKYVDAAIKTPFQKMIDTLSNQNIRVIPLDSFDIEAVAASYFVLTMAETSSNLARLDGSVYGARSNNKNVQEGYMITRAENLSDETKRRIIGGIQVTSHGFDDDVYRKALIFKNQLLDAYKRDFENVDIILSPVSLTLPPIQPVSADIPPAIGQDMQPVSLTLPPIQPVSADLPPAISQNPDNTLATYLSEAFTAGFNLGGLPTLTAPLFTPTGIQITADKNREDFILTFANYLEEAEPWT